MTRTGLTLSLVVASTVVGLMGTDLVLPAVPHLPEAFGATAETAQLVLAGYAAGTCAGLLGFGLLSERFATRHVFLGSLIATSMLSLACTMAPSLGALVVLRALQGAAATAPAVLAPAIIKALFAEAAAVRTMGLLSSIESLAPALAPIAGAALLVVGDWRLSFLVLASAASVLAILLSLIGSIPQISRRKHGSYGQLLGDSTFLRYALSQAFVLGGLLIFVFGLPSVLVRVFGGTINDFILIQVLAILTYIASANLAGRAVTRYGPEAIIMFGTALCAAGSAGQLLYAAAGGLQPMVILLLFIPVNVGLGLRGPPGFYCAVVAARGDDARGSALVLLGIFGTTAVGTTIASAFIEQGTIPLAAVAFALHATAVISLMTLPALAVTEP